MRWSVMQSASQVEALAAVYSLTTHKDVGHLHPLGKFLAIKSIVVFSCRNMIAVRLL